MDPAPQDAVDDLDHLGHDAAKPFAPDCPMLQLCVNFALHRRDRRVLDNPFLHEEQLDRITDLEMRNPKPDITVAPPDLEVASVEA